MTMKEMEALKKAEKYAVLCDKLQALAFVPQVVDDKAEIKTYRIMHKRVILIDGIPDKETANQIGEELNSAITKVRLRVNKSYKRMINNLGSDEPEDDQQPMDYPTIPLAPVSIKINPDSPLYGNQTV
jgi:hypothetical protein